ncbi:hypothetical protein BDV25DRAFT_136012 [Aspergillus avenaceus]|uniref:EthD domain-containing protein n=1 Tax=Aspergillus avenaceus TaxID=36643 RepID=A0A5N6U7D0_ASPAV|nr:hypothetical protein BDV25DRAFT_136012 [Aspergillus avenaceus]
MDTTKQPVTELALLRIKPYVDAAVIRPTLSAAAKAQAEYSTFPVHLLQQIEDPACIYLLGGWRSVSVHMDDWIPSDTNQGLLASLKDKLDVEWVIHVNIDPTPSLTESDEGIPLNAPTIAIERYFIAPGRTNDFVDTFYSNKNRLKEYIAPHIMKGGRRLDPITGHEFLFFSGWDTAQDHLEFAKSEGFKGFEQMTKFLDGVDIKHASVWGS